MKLQQLGCAVPGRSYSPTSAAPYLPEAADQSTESSFLPTSTRHSIILLQDDFGGVYLNLFPEIINKCTTKYFNSLCCFPTYRCLSCWISWILMDYIFCFHRWQRTQIVLLRISSWVMAWQRTVVQNCYQNYSLFINKDIYSIMSLIVQTVQTIRQLWDNLAFTCPWKDKIGQYIIIRYCVKYLQKNYD